ncbi:unnamed protein product [Meloidogyne enterolobii]|uniref:Uncharacterized protein n=1 Tax=Meloidogyne enterolobii TaxID=390850 RepID=A0ACB0ZWJ2_MELEN
MFVFNFFNSKIIFQIDKESKKHGGELVASVLKIYDTRHEVNAVFAADAGLIFLKVLSGVFKFSLNKFGNVESDRSHFSSPSFFLYFYRMIRLFPFHPNLPFFHQGLYWIVNIILFWIGNIGKNLRRKKGVCQVQITMNSFEEYFLKSFKFKKFYGVTNTITSLKNAQLAESPVILLAGAAPSLMKGKGALQDIDQIPIIQSMCKFTARIINVGDIVPILREAISVSQSGTPGPVFIEFPLDVLQSYQEVLRDASLIKNPDTPEKVKLRK